MKLGSIEQAFMHNCVRKWFLQHIETQLFNKLLKNKKPKSILEIGCGRGDAIITHEKIYSPIIHSAIDIDIDLIRMALFKKVKLHLNHVRIKVGDVRNIDEPDEIFDAVFGYGVLHHVENWQKGLHEIARVLKPKGVYCWEEPFEYFSNLFISRLLLSHPDVGMTYRNWMNELNNCSLPVYYGWPIKNPFITLGISIKK
jgi:ubiquinone/menaquinone biosynthesis C-methylase UbiE